MGSVQITVYVLGWLIIVNTVWVTCQAVYKPTIFHWMNKRPSGHYLLDGSITPFSERRAYAHIIGALIGYFSLFMIMFNLALSFIPGNWGSLDEYGEFVAIRDTISSIASLLMTALIWSAISYAGDRSYEKIAAKKETDILYNELTESRKEISHTVLQVNKLREEVREIGLNSSRQKNKYERQIKRLRSLVLLRLFVNMIKINAKKLRNLQEHSTVEKYIY